MDNTGPIVTTSAGDVRGAWKTGGAVFLGIPYAAAPVGDFRFAAPQPPEPWSDVRDVTQPGATPQRRLLGLEPSFPEPCIPGDETLNVNVFTPAPAEPGRRLPVMVWIHGGGFAAGSPVSPWYDGRSFSRDGVVVVTISYRLGFDGFGWIADASMNRGTLDQIAALEWVRDNIAAFGGDPAAVTVAGQSAGGTSVMTLFTASRAQSLFRAAICMSGADRVQSMARAEQTGRALAASAGVEPTVAGWSALTEDQALDAQDSFHIATPPSIIDPAAFVRHALTPTADLGMPFGPVIDGDLLRCSVSDALASGVAEDKPLLIGVTAHEFTLWMLHAEEQLRGVDVAEAMVEAGLPRELAADYVASHAELPTAAALLGQLIGIRTFRQPMAHWTDLRAKTSPDTTWLYDFRWPSPFYSDLAVHCVELPFAWNLLDADGVSRTHGSNPPRKLAEVTHAAWVAFVANGDPGWRPGSHGVGMVFNETSGEQPVLEIERRLASAAVEAWPAGGSGRGLPVRAARKVLDAGSALPSGGLPGLPGGPGACLRDYHRGDAVQQAGQQGRVRRMLRAALAVDPHRRGLGVAEQRVARALEKCEEGVVAVGPQDLSRPGLGRELAAYSLGRCGPARGGGVKPDRSARADPALDESEPRQPVGRLAHRLLALA